MKILTEAVKLNKDFWGHCIQQHKFLTFEFTFYKNLWIFKHSSIKNSNICNIGNIGKVVLQNCESLSINCMVAGTNSNCFNWADK